MIERLLDEESRDRSKSRTTCPDGGTCHHVCPPDPKTEPCFRTLWCAPFSAYNDGQWKEGDE